MGYPVTITIPDDVLNELIKKNKIKLNSDVIRAYMIEVLKEQAFKTYDD